jgi:hypothetical protein
MRKIFFAGMILLFSSSVYGDSQKRVSEVLPGPGKIFVYTARKLGIPILNVSIKITNGSSSDPGRPLSQIQAFVHSLNGLGVFFRMHNRFTSTMEAGTCFPVQYVKEIDQEGLLIGKKNYLETFTFDHPNKKVIVQNKDKKEKQEVPIPPHTFDPLSMFARCYLKEELSPGQSVRMSIYDGIRLRDMVFSLRKEKVTSKLFGETEAVCLESTTSFSTFGEKEGTIRIWYITQGEKIPISMELELPIGNVKFELESIERS